MRISDKKNKYRKKRYVTAASVLATVTISIEQLTVCAGSIFAPGNNPIIPNSPSAVPSDQVLPISGAAYCTDSAFLSERNNTVSELSDGSVLYSIAGSYSYDSLTESNDKPQTEADNDAENESDSPYRFATEDDYKKTIPDSISLYKNSSMSATYSDVDFSVSGDTITIGLNLDTSDSVLSSAFPVFSLTDAQCNFYSPKYSGASSPDFSKLASEYDYINEDGSINLLKDPILYVTDSGNNTVMYHVRAEYMSDIPVLHINLDDPNATIDRYNTVDATLMIDGIEYPMAIRGRGNTSWWNFPQKSYQIKFEDDTSLLGTEPSDKFALVPTYLDNSLIRNPLSARLAACLDNMEYNTYQTPVDIFLNGKYIGVYTFSEKIDVAMNKVNLFSEDFDVPSAYITSPAETHDESADSSADTLPETPFLLETGGDFRVPHTMGKDFFTSTYTPKLFFKYPEFSTANTDEFKYVKKYIDDTGNAIYKHNGYDEYIDTASFVDWFILMELTCNTDSAFWRSTYVYKRPGEKLMIGPVWDFDRAYGNFHNDNKTYQYWASAEQVYDLAQNHWFSYLYESDEFMVAVKFRWDEKKDELLGTALDAIDEYGDAVRYSRSYHGALYGNYGGESSLKSLKKFVIKRYNWIDESIHMDDFNRRPAPYTVSDPVWNEDETMLQPVDTGLDTPPVDTTVIPQDNTMVVDGAVSFPFFDDIDESAFTYEKNLYEPDDESDSVSDNAFTPEVSLSDYDTNTAYDEATAVFMNFTGAGLICSTNDDGSNIKNRISVSGNIITIKAPGDYVLSGTLYDGQVRIDSDAAENVHLIMNGAHLSCRTSSAIYSDSADKLIITLADGTDNSLSDASEYLPDDKAKGCLYSKCDLTINGGGVLHVTGNYNNAISCKDDIKIAGGDLYIYAKNNGIKGNDSVSVFDGTIRVTAGSDAVKSDNDENPEKGFIYIEKGEFALTAGDDVFQCPTAFYMTGGAMNARCYDDLVKCDGDIIGTELINFRF